MVRITGIIACLLLTALFMFCVRDDNPVSSDTQQELKTTVVFSPQIVFKQGAVEVAPDSVDTIRITIQYGDNFIIKKFPFSAHTGLVEGVPANTAFTAKVEGLDRRGDVIYLGIISVPGASDDFSVTITASQVTPRAPSDLRLAAQTATSVQVQWSDNSSNELGFFIERSQGNDSTYIPIDTAIPDQNALMDRNNLTGGVIYYYRVCGYNGAGKSAYLTAQAVQTPAIQFNDTVPPVLLVDALPDSVAGDSVTVTGKVHDTSGVSLVTVNGDTATMGTDSGFTRKVGLLYGLNTVTVRAVDNSSGKNDTSISFDIVYDSTASDVTPPVITVTAYEDFDTVGSLDLFLAGTVNDPGSRVDTFKVNGNVVTVADINWSASVVFPAAGLQAVYFQAVDKRGNRAFDTLRLVVDTAKIDSVKPVISFGGLAPGYIFNVTNPMITVQVTENGSGIDTVYIGNGVAALVGSDYRRTVTLTPDSNKIIVVAKDKAGNRGRDSIVVILNRPPVFSTAPAAMTATAYLNQSYKDTVIATDPDGATGLSYTRISPSNLTVGISNGLILWTPTVVTSVSCTVVVQDKYGYKDSLVWGVTVVDTSTANVAPVFAGGMLATAMHAVGYLDTVHATDVNGDVVTYAFLTLPPGMKMTDSILQWVPNPAITPGSFPVQIEASDNRGGKDSLNFNVVLSYYVPSGREYVNDSNTVALWHLNERMDDTIYDLSYLDKSGALSGFALSNGYLGFNNSQGKIKLTSSIDPLRPEHTVEFDLLLFDAPSTAIDVFVISKTAGVEISRRANEFTASTNSSSASATQIVNASTNLIDSTWHRIKCVTDSFIAQLWIDSILVAQKSPTASAGGKPFIDSILIGGPGYFGYIDEIRLSNKSRYNRRPVFWQDSTEMTNAVFVGFQYSDTVHATDPDHDTLSFMKLSGPAALIVTDSIISWRPGEMDVGNKTVKIRVADGKGYFDTLGWTILVSNPPPPSGMKLLPSGTFQMGSTIASDEQPVHAVTVSSFWMDSTEVTQADYAALMGNNPSSFTGDPLRPVEQVTWFDAVLYCNARSKRDSRDTVYSYTSKIMNAANCTSLVALTIDTAKTGYRLPTEAEWEYACRAGSITAYYWGREYPTANRIDTAAMDANCWWTNNSGSQTHPVATRTANAFGLYDMSGNVYEWCNDWYGSAYYSSSPGTDPAGPATGTTRVLRGGSWSCNTRLIYSAVRAYGPPRDRINGLGLRVVVLSR